jgi:hypothetical protein
VGRGGDCWSARGNVDRQRPVFGPRTESGSVTDKGWELPGASYRVTHHPLGRCAWRVRRGAWPVQFHHHLWAPWWHQRVALV